MRIAIISDIHGNRVALDAVLAGLNNEHVDQIVCLGDVAATGPQPHEVVERLKALDRPVVMGNTDAWLLSLQSREAMDETFLRIMEIDRWCAEQLSSTDLDYLRTFQPTVGLPRDPPWAEYALVRWENGKLSIELRRMPLDVDAVIQAALTSGMPHAEWWAGEWRNST